MSARRVATLACCAAVVAGALGPARAAAAGPAPAPGSSDPLILVVDISGSMSDDDGAGTRKIDGAKQALLDYVDTVQRGSLVGLRTFPDQSGPSCNSGRLAIPIGPVDPATMSARIRALQPDGDTPTAEAMRAAVRDLEAQGQHRGTLVIVSDGEANCGDPCQAARDIRRDGFDLQTLTVGFRISDEGRKQLRCISDELDGRYLDIERSKDLRDTLDRLGRPRISVALEGGARRDAIAGGDEVEIAATVTNSGEVEAQDVIGQFTFRAQGADVRRPVVRLGNLPPHASRRIAWKVRAGPSVVDRDVGFVVVGRAVNATDSGLADGVLRGVGVKTLAEAGAILHGAGGPIAILGDSYSAGEGADRYEAGTDTDRDGCHRSPLTYLIPAASRGDRPDLLACSGAVIEHLTGSDIGNHEPPQLTKLKQLQSAGRPARAVVMTIGGNDARFGDLGHGCVAGRRSCIARIFPRAPINEISSEATSDFVAETIGAQSTVERDLVSAYKAVDGVLNDPAAVARRGRDAPILVLAYPLPIPLTGRTCAPMGAFTLGVGPLSHTFYLLSAQEIDFLADFALRLNAHVEAAVLRARSEGVPVFYVPSTELALEPSHTFCDDGKARSATEPFARSVASWNGAGLNRETLGSLLKDAVLGRTVSFAGTSVQAFLRGWKEIAHPNAAGYGAVTLALLRWSKSKAADAAVAFTRTAQPAAPAPLSWKASDVDLGQLAPDELPTLQGGTSYRLTAGGFEPGTPVDVELHSAPIPLGTLAADAHGRVATRIPIPRELDAGRHALVLSGVGPGGRPHTLRVAFAIERSSRLSARAAMGAASAIALLLGLVLTMRTGGLPLLRRFDRSMRDDLA